MIFLKQKSFRGSIKQAVVINWSTMMLVKIGSIEVFFSSYFVKQCTLYICIIELVLKPVNPN